MLFKSSFILVSLGFFSAAAAFNPAARLPRESLERRAANNAIGDAKVLKQFDAHRAPQVVHQKRQASKALVEPTHAAKSVVGLAVTTGTAFVYRGLPDDFDINSFEDLVEAATAPEEFIEAVTGSVQN